MLSSPSRTSQKSRKPSAPAMAWAGTSTITALRRNRALLPPQLSRPPDRRVDSSPRRPKRSWKAGAKVADVGCGLGTSTILMAQAYPKSTFVGSITTEVDRDGARGRGQGRRGRSCEIRGRESERLSGQRSSTSSHSSIACTTWAIRKAPHGTCWKRSPPMGRG